MALNTLNAEIQVLKRILDCIFNGSISALKGGGYRLKNAIFRIKFGIKGV